MRTEMSPEKISFGRSEDCCPFHCQLGFYGECDWQPSRVSSDRFQSMRDTMRDLGIGPLRATRQIVFTHARWLLGTSRACGTLCIDDGL